MTSGKISHRDALKEIIASLKAQGKKVGYTSGVFDLLHPGHVQYLEDAKKLCDVLVVGVNSDSSVKQIKNINRPINDERSRCEVISGLSSVDYVFIFDELNNNQNVTVLKPDLYLKAGDYPLDKLSSKPLVESYGGTVMTVPVKQGYSTTSIINRIAALYGERHASIAQVYTPTPALFVDRDGTLIEHVEYLHEVQKLKFIPGAIEALKQVSAKGYRIILVTNQPGIGLGYFTKEDLFKLNKEILREASSQGLFIDKIYYCPHSKSDHCPCRKPGIGLLKRAESELRVDLPKSYVVGDMTSDLELAKKAGCHSVLVRTGAKGEDGLYNVKPDIAIDSLADIASLLPEANTSKKLESEVPAILHRGELQTVGYVTARIGHDLNNIIGSMLGALDLIRTRSEKNFKGENPLEKPLSLMASAIQKAKLLASKIRGYARPSYPTPYPVSLKMIIDKAVSEFLKAYDGVAIAVQCPSNLTVLSEPFFIEQILFSLFKNSVHAAQKNVSLQIDAIVTCKNNKAFLSIKDNGVGLEPHALSALFEPFQSKNARGFGLSLSMAKEILSSLGGGISVTSSKGKGTTVFIELPCVD